MKHPVSTYFHLRHPRRNTIVKHIQEAQRTLAHEIGHNLGASHDLPKWCGHAYLDGYLMSPVAPVAALATRKSRQFSPCSLEAIEKARV